MVPLDRSLVSSYMLSVVTMSLSAAVWSQFAMQSYTFSWKRYLFTDSGTNLYGSSTVSMISI